MNYSQPSFYHFSQDSVELAKFVHHHIGEQKNINVIDIASGCGVIALEWYQLNSSKELKITFVELQKEYKKHLETNCNDLGIDAEILITDFINYNFSCEYDLVFCNPPYFFNGEGRVSENQRKERCRRVDEAVMKTWIAKLKSLVLLNGSIFVCFRNDEWFRNNTQGLTIVTFKNIDNYYLYHLKK